MQLKVIIDCFRGTGIVLHPWGLFQKHFCCPQLSEKVTVKEKKYAKI